MSNQMKEIDWSKAPGCAVAALVATTDNVHYPSVEFVTGYHAYGCMIRATSAVDGRSLSAPSDCWFLVDRPVSHWAGEGLPPVGAMVEIRLMGWSIRESAEKFIGVPLRVAASFGMDCGTDMIAVDGGPDLGCEVFRAEMAVPARTPEQIAAEERARAIDEMWSVYWQPEAPTAKEALGLLYDAGYRKVSP